jgi:hypothetical protein
MKARISWWLTFILATVSLSKVFAASRLLTSGAAQGSITNLLLWGIVLLISLLILGYDSYVKAKQEGKVVHPIWLFEKFQQLRHREIGQ